GGAARRGRFARSDAFAAREGSAAGALLRAARAGPLRADRDGSAAWPAGAVHVLDVRQRAGVGVRCVPVITAAAQSLSQRAWSLFTARQHHHPKGGVMNHITLTGRLVDEPVLRQLPDGGAVCRLRLAGDGVGPGRETRVADGTGLGT